MQSSGWPRDFCSRSRIAHLLSSTFEFFMHFTLVQFFLLFFSRNKMTLCRKSSVRWKKESCASFDCQVCCFACMRTRRLDWGCYVWRPRHWFATWTNLLVRSQSYDPQNVSSDGLCIIDRCCIHKAAPEANPMKFCILHPRDHYHWSILSLRTHISYLPRLRFLCVKLALKSQL